MSMTTQAWDRGTANLVRLANQGLEAAAFRQEALKQLRSLLSIDAAFFATVDPATLLFTSAIAEEPLASSSAVFLDNEFGRADVNKFVTLALSGDPVGSLDHATKGDRMTSARYREVISPLGLGDEMRVALVVSNHCWGVLCLHREASERGFDEMEIALLRRISPVLAGGLRNGIANVSAASDEGPAGGAGIVILSSDMTVVSINPQAERWLAEIADLEWSTGLPLPAPIYAAAARVILAADDDAQPAVTRLRRATGGWIAVQASALRGTVSGQVAILLDAASHGQTSSLILAAHGLTAAQSRVVALVLRGRSTPQITTELQISSNTVQEHLHAVFEKFGIGSRRELVAALSDRSTV